MKKVLLPVLIFVLSASLWGCTMPTGPTVCTPGELVAPGLVSPPMWAVVWPAPPDLTWASTDSSVPYPYDSCFPTGYHVTLHQVPSSFDLGASVYGPHVLHWSPIGPLTPATEYHWGVNAFAPAGDGPYTGDWVFFTGPVCATSALAAPTLGPPTNGAILAELRPTLSWDYPDPCVPQGYRIDLSTDASFADTSLSGGTGNPSTRWSPGTELSNCTTYYWRVAPINDTTLGPFSITRNFMIDTGSCIYPVPTLVIAPIITVPPPHLEPMFTLDKNANCRYGPSQVFEIKASFFQGDVVPIDGRNDEGNWLYARMQDNDHCWVSIVTGKFDGDLDLLLVVEGPPPPEEQPTYSSCGDYSTQALCKQDPGGIGNCYWGPNNSCLQGKP